MHDFIIMRKWFLNSADKKTLDSLVILQQKVLQENAV